MSPHLGGDERVRTADPLRAKQVLSQLSYTPVFACGSFPLCFRFCGLFEGLLPQNYIVLRVRSLQAPSIIQ